MLSNGLVGSGWQQQQGQDRRDDRWNVSKKKQVFVCNQCLALVRFSKAGKESTFRRADCEFAGSYMDKSWSALPVNLRRTAWEMCLIDATWHCHQVCHAKMTLGQKEKRDARTAAFTATQTSGGQIGKRARTGQASRQSKGKGGARSSDGRA